MAAAKNCGTANISGSLSEAGGRIGQEIWTTVQFRISHLNRRPHFFSKPLGFGPETRLHGELVRKETKHLGQKQLAARWSISEASLERWRSEGIGPKFLKLPGRVLYRQVDIEAFEESCLSTSTKTLTGPVRFE